jgi:hypothetical protein
MSDMEAPNFCEKYPYFLMLILTAESVSSRPAGLLKTSGSKMVKNK